MTPSASVPFLAWPGTRHLRFAARQSLLPLAVFCLLYGTADFLTGMHAFRLRIHGDWETAIPFLPAFALPYLSILPAFVLSPFIIRDAGGYREACRAFAWMTALAAPFFLAVPVELGYAPVLAEGFFAPAFRLADRINLTHNELPSLHVAFAAALAWLYGKGRGAPGRALAALWAFSVFAATLFLHQHHVLSAISGAALAWLGLLAARRGSLPTAPSSQSAAAAAAAGRAAAAAPATAGARPERVR